MSGQEPHEEIVLRGPVSLANGEGQIARNILVAIGSRLYRIPIPAQGCKEIAEGLTLTDEELRDATERQAASRLLVAQPGINGHRLSPN